MKIFTENTLNRKLVSKFIGNGTKDFSLVDQVCNNQLFFCFVFFMIDKFLGIKITKILNDILLQQLKKFEYIFPQFAI